MQRVARLACSVGGSLPAAMQSSYKAAGSRTAHIARGFTTSRVTRVGLSAPTKAFSIVSKRNITYISYIVVGAIVLEVAFGSVMDKAWLAMNGGVSTNTITVRHCCLLAA